MKLSINKKNLATMRLMIVLIFGVLASWTVAGCSSSSSESDPFPTPQPTVAASPQIKPTTAPEPIASQPAQLEVKTTVNPARGNTTPLPSGRTESSSQEAETTSPSENARQRTNTDSKTVAPAKILWSTDHESGTFYEWSRGSGWNFWDETQQKAVESGTGPRIFGKAIFNSNTPPGDCQTTISQDVSRSGTYALKMNLQGATQKASQGCRVFRTWLDTQDKDGVPLPDEGYYSAWYYLPQEVTTIEWWNIFQFKSSSDTVGSEPMLSFNIDSNGKGERSLYVYHKKGDKSCDCLGSCKNESYGGDLAEENLPLQEWFQIEAYVDQSTIQGDKVSADGALAVWVNGIQVIEQENICTLLRSDSRLHWSVNNYANDIIPPDVLLYVDDAAISAQRLGSDR